MRGWDKLETIQDALGQTVYVGNTVIYNKSSYLAKGIVRELWYKKETTRYGERHRWQIHIEHESGVSIVRDPACIVYAPQDC